MMTLFSAPIEKEFQSITAREVDCMTSIAVPSSLQTASPRTSVPPCGNWADTGAVYVTSIVAAIRSAKVRKEKRSRLIRPIRALLPLCSCCPMTRITSRPLCG